MQVELDEMHALMEDSYNNLAIATRSGSINSQARNAREVEEHPHHEEQHNGDGDRDRCIGNGCHLSRFEDTDSRQGLITREGRR